MLKAELQTGAYLHYCCIVMIVFPSKIGFMIFNGEIFTI